MISYRLLRLEFQKQMQRFFYFVTTILRFSCKHGLANEKIPCNANTWGFRWGKLLHPYFNVHPNGIAYAIRIRLRFLRIMERLLGDSDRPLGVFHSRVFQKCFQGVMEIVRIFRVEYIRK